MCGDTAWLSHAASPQRRMSSSTAAVGDASTITCSSPSCNRGTRHGHTANTSTLCAAASPPTAAVAVLTALTSASVCIATHRQRGDVRRRRGGWVGVRVYEVRTLPGSSSEQVMRTHACAIPSSPSPSSGSHRPTCDIRTPTACQPQPAPNASKRHHSDTTQHTHLGVMPAKARFVLDGHAAYGSLQHRELSCIYFVATRRPGKHSHSHTNACHVKLGFGKLPRETHTEQRLAAR
jgi:hypothetical protein